MKAGRIRQVTVSEHETIVLALYRSMPPAGQRDIDGLLYGSARDAGAGFLREGRCLGVHELDASCLKPFVRAAGLVAGVMRKAA